MGPADLTGPNYFKEGQFFSDKHEARQAQGWFWLFLLLNPLNAPWIFAAAACTSGSVRSMSVKWGDQEMTSCHNVKEKEGKYAKDRSIEF